jgi:hypothetical protein
MISMKISVRSNNPIAVRECDGVIVTLPAIPRVGETVQVKTYTFPVRAVHYKALLGSHPQGGNYIAGNEVTLTLGD